MKETEFNKTMAFFIDMGINFSYSYGVESRGLSEDIGSDEPIYADCIFIGCERFYFDCKTGEFLGNFNTEYSTFHKKKKFRIERVRKNV